ncbi:hypothetical protein ACFOY2_28135 [Nonomuraea purpurea]|uniref:DUF397 domain-containing protein n=1 Tax=Nonomuraea purpurea TaxID=1849276 RepID=A0ABV8GEJ6_9ACTN
MEGPTAEERFRKDSRDLAAGELALIGLAAGDLTESEGGEVVIRLDPRQVSHALFAAGLWGRAQGGGV